MRLRKIRDDPLAHFLPIKHTPNGSFFCAGPPGLNPELANLFMQQLHHSTAQKRQGAAIDKTSNKRARLGEQDEVDDEIEQARRAGSLASGLGLGIDIMDPRGVSLDDHFDGGQQFMNDLEVGSKEPEVVPIDLNLERPLSVAPSELTQFSTSGLNEVFLDENEESYASVDCPIATFDPRPISTQAQTQDEIDETVDEGKGYSKNTVKALALVRKELRVEEGSSEKMISFRQMADKVRDFFPNSLILSENYQRQLDEPQVPSSSSSLS